MYSKDVHKNQSKSHFYNSIFHSNDWALVIRRHAKYPLFKGYFASAQA